MGCGSLPPLFLHASLLKKDLLLLLLPILILLACFSFVAMAGITNGQRIDTEPFGLDGKAQLFTLCRGSKMKLIVTNWGASIVSLILPDRLGTSRYTQMIFSQWITLMRIL